jgi:hypothetical protein
VSATVLPIRLTVRVLDDDGAPWPGKVHLVLADRPDTDHRLTVAPDASDADLGRALRRVIAHQLAARVDE